MPPRLGQNRNHPYRLIFGYHWRGGTANDAGSGGSDGANWSYYGLMRLASNSAIFVAPQRLERIIGTRSSPAPA
ncbi:hypothetical protein H4W32_002204 [Actinophytocola algeriensis]|uniref:Uncharacterized protein n=1 Tax=Actinophytocola algeriensis TaxID=1768010 RepID=A0A7W7QFY2_9PSEU|nr:hypothetical protein [Actinophytocola algeriensis]MBE1474162.1 hypothetical protein [Actinophytocola algeriensis]